MQIWHFCNSNNNNGHETERKLTAAVTLMAEVMAGIPE
jgi:hypothetical protein